LPSNQFIFENLEGIVSLWLSMKVFQRHPWSISYGEAIGIQDSLKSRLLFKKLPKAINYVAGCDVSCSKNTNLGWAGIVILTYPDFIRVEKKWAKGMLDFPYIPGLLSFREIPLLLEAFQKLEIEPDLILCDGQGIAHPRGLGLAAHLGLLIDKPSIGCAKKRLVGEFREVGSIKGDLSPLFYKGKKVGAVIRTKTGVKPLFVSPGYAVTIEDAIEMVLSCVDRYRIPEPIRQAHLLVNQLRLREEVL
jgi:deoxyribonuclease V